MKLPFQSLAICLALSSCATYVPPTDEPALLISKIEHGTIKQLKGQSRSTQSASLTPIVGSANAPLVSSALESLMTGTSLGEKLGLTQTLIVFAYVVRTNSGRVVTMLSEYPGFKVGDCMKLLESTSDNTYPRLAYGGGCK